MTVVDLFAGPGGWDLAARELGLDPLGVELDEAACETRDAAGLRTLQEDVAALEPRPCDGLIASPPCQAWSMAGKRGGERDKQYVYECAAGLAAGEDRRAELAARCEDARSMLVVEPLRWALAVRPTWLAWEQVPPVLEFWEFCADLLRAEGYGVWTGVLSAERFGVPQTRLRAFLLAHRDRPVAGPAPTHQRYIAPRRPKQEEGLFDAGPRKRIVHPDDRVLLPWVSMAEALGWAGVDRPAPTVTGGGTASGGPEVFGRGGRAAIRVFDRRQTGGDGTPVAPRPVPEPAPTLQAQGLAKGRDVWLRSGQSVAGEGRAMRSAGEPALSIIGRADLCAWVTERPAPTITTTRRSKDGMLVGRQLPPGEGENVGGHGWTAGRPATTVNGDPRISRPGHHDEHESGSQQRDAIRVTVQEAATLQGFPPDHPWQGSRSKQYEQIGNAVPPPLARAVLGQVVDVAAEAAA